MKTLIAASILALASGGAIADWEDVFRNPDLSHNFDGHRVAQQRAASDPVERSYAGNADLYAGGMAAASSAGGATSYDRFVRGNPDIDVCGCI